MENIKSAFIKHFYNEHDKNFGSQAGDAVA